MPKYDQNQAECLVFTFKDGLLSKMAHDLKIQVTRFEVNVADAAVRAEFDLQSLRVLTAMKDGQESPEALSDADKAKIGDQIVKDVLQSGEHRSAVFTSRSVSQRPDGGYDITGELQLHGVTQPINAQTNREGGRQVASINLHQPDYGITPYKAMMGALKVQPGVVVRLSVPAA
jgi:hypothetical protein